MHEVVVAYADEAWWVLDMEYEGEPGWKIGPYCAQASALHHAERVVRHRGGEKRGYVVRVE